MAGRKAFDDLVNLVVQRRGEEHSIEWEEQFLEQMKGAHGANGQQSEAQDFTSSSSHSDEADSKPPETWPADDPFWGESAEMYEI